MSSHQDFENFIKDVEAIERNLSETDIKPLDSFIGDRGITDLPKYIQDKLKEQVFINIAVTGSSGAGKSSFINAARGLTADDDGAAKVGATQTTKYITKYLDPKNKNIRYYDLPGIGTPEFKQRSYIEKFKLDKFDIVLLLSCGSFSENDQELADLALCKKIPFKFARTKMNDAVESDKKAHPNTHDRDNLCHVIISDIKTELQRIRTETERKKSRNETRFQRWSRYVVDIIFGSTGNVEAGIKSQFDREKIYLIDSYATSEFEFAELIKDIIESLPRQQREVMTNDVFSFSEQFIHRKKTSLMTGAVMVTLSISAGEIDPPVALKKQMHIYKGHFGLDDVSLQKTAKRFNVSFKSLIKEENIDEMWRIASNGKHLIAAIAKLANLVVSVSSKESALGTVGKFAMVFTCLQYMIIVLERDALRLNSEIYAQHIEEQNCQ